MFPFNYIPETIDPTIRKLIISLISIQFIAFLILILTLIYEFCMRKRFPQSDNKKNNKGDTELNEVAKKTESERVKEEKNEGSSKHKNE